MDTNLTKIEIAISSPVFWAMIGVFLIAGLSAIAPQLQGTPELVVMAIIAGIGALLHPSEIQKAGSTQ